MIITVTLNPAVDKYIFLDDLYLDKTNKIISKMSIYGGKGINVSNYLGLLKQDNVATGFVFADDEKMLEGHLSEYTTDDFLYINGKTRENLKINYQGKLLEVNDNNHINENHWQLFLKKYEKYLKRGNIIVLSGSLPIGISDDSYAYLAKIAKENGCFVILDSSGKALKNAYSYVDMIKPNKEEYCFLKGIEYDDISKYKITSDILTVISLGKEGSLLICEHEIYKIAPLNVKVYSTVGAGDSMVAAFAYGLQNKMPIMETMKLASALSSLVITEDYRNDFEQKLSDLMRQAKVEKL